MANQESARGLLGTAWLVAALPLGDHMPLTEGSLLAGHEPPLGSPSGLLWRKRHKNYALPDDPRQHVTFALRYEPLRQDILKAVFHATGPEMWRQFVLDNPRGRQAARAAFYYERLTRSTLDCPNSQAAPVRALDPTAYFTASDVLNQRWHVYDNLPGSPGFCPLVRRTEMLSQHSAYLRTILSAALAGADAELVARASYYLSVKDTKASFAIEHEAPSPDRTRRFVQAVSAYSQTPLTPEHLCAVQNAIIDNPLLHSVAGTYRQETVYVGESRGGQYGIGWERVHFVAPAPQQVDDLMRSWFAALDHRADDPIAAAAVAAFGLVFIHPFADGNGRTHRFVLQHLLAEGGLCPRGMALPLSAWWERHTHQYDAALEAFSRPLMQSLRYTMDHEGVLTAQNDLTDAYRYFDATAQAEAIGRAVQSVLTEDIPQEIRFLRVFDAAKVRLREVIDLPNKETDIALHTILREGRMSTKKRKRYFPHLSDENMARIEKAVLGNQAKAGVGLKDYDHQENPGAHALPATLEDEDIAPR